MSQLAYETLGNPRAHAVMLLHGFMSSNAQWLANQDALSERYRLVKVELWGHGNSPEPNDADQYSIAAYVEQFETIRRTLAIDRWTLVGQSYGAGLTIHYALRHPECCRGLIATNSRSAFGRPTTQKEHARSRVHAAEDAYFDPRRLPYHPIHARRFPEAIKRDLVENADAMSLSAVRNGGRLGASLNCVEALGRLAVPIVLINGVYEKSFQQDVKALLERYPNLQIIELPGGHSVNIEAADQFDSACLKFLDAVSRGCAEQYLLRGTRGD